LAEERLLDHSLSLPTGVQNRLKSACSFRWTLWARTLRTRVRNFREKLRSGALDERIVELELSFAQMPSMQVMGPFSMEEMGVNLQEVFGNILPKERKTSRKSNSH